MKVFKVVMTVIFIIMIIGGAIAIPAGIIEAIYLFGVKELALGLAMWEGCKTVLILAPVGIAGSFGFLLTQ